MIEILKDYYWLIILILVFGISFLMPTDSTDKSRWSRSGMSLYTDHTTGVQYVKGGFFGGTTVRVEKDGKPYLGDLQ